MAKEKSHLEKKVRKYLIATLTSPVTYMYKKPAHQEYKFFKDIEKSTKFMERQDAEETIIMYYHMTQDTGLELVVLPIDVSFELIEEIEITE